MDRIGKYPDDPAALVLGENSTLAVLAHETGHRWLALLLFRDERGGQRRICCSAASARTGASSSIRTRR